MNLSFILPAFNIGLNSLYIDPASTSVLLSSLTAIGVALGATLMISWRNFKKKCKNVIDLDEEERAIVEESLVIYEEDALGEVAVTEETGVKTLKF